MFDRAVADPARQFDPPHLQGPEERPSGRLGRGALRGMLIGAPLAAALWGCILLVGWLLL